MNATKVRVKISWKMTRLSPRFWTKLAHFIAYFLLFSFSKTGRHKTEVKKLTIYYTMLAFISTPLRNSNPQHRAVTPPLSHRGYFFKVVHQLRANDCQNYRLNKSHSCGVKNQNIDKSMFYGYGYIDRVRLKHQT